MDAHTGNFSEFAAFLKEFTPQRVSRETGLTQAQLWELADIIHNGFDPYKEFYEPHGIARTVYNVHVKEDACIIALMSSGGAWVYVPTHYIVSYPNQGGIPYTSLVMGLDLGPIPNHLNLTGLKQKLIDVVRDYVGINSTATTVAVSETKLLSHDNHTAIEAARVALIDSSETDYSRYLSVKAQRDALQSKVAEYEAYFIANPPTP